MSKYTIFHIKKKKMERRLKGVRPDVSFCLDGKTYIAVEIQKSSIPCDIIKQRMKRYTKLGIHLIWIFPHIESIDDRTFNKWTKYIANIQHRFFYYSGNGILKYYDFIGWFRELIVTFKNGEVKKAKDLTDEEIDIILEENMGKYEIENKGYYDAAAYSVNKVRLEKDFQPATNHWYKILELKEV